MHSYNELDPELRKALDEHQAIQAAETQRRIAAAMRAQAARLDPDPLGPTDRFPDGKLTEADQGELRFQIGTVKGKVVLNFGGPTHALGFSPEQALGLADLLRKHARSLMPAKNHNGKNRNGRSK